MSANQSDLTNPQYGYDFVVATTQESINSTLKEYLYNTYFPVVQMYWNQDADGNPVLVSRDTLLQQTNGTDPLTVPSWNNSEPATPAIQNINNSNFYFAFQASIGIPPDMAPQNIPDIITLQPASQSVIFNLICAQFTVVTCNFGRQGMTSFLNASQPDDTPWLFTSIVPLKQITNNSNLPPAVQAQLDNLGPDAFSVQQLFFDLDNAALESTPTISGVTPGTPVYNLLSQVFLGAYFTAMQATAQPILNYAIVQNTPDPDPSTLMLTNLELEVSPYAPAGPSTGDLNTLNYLCAINGNNLPQQVPFAWNWIEQSEEDLDGVVSINSADFIAWLGNLLSQDLNTICYIPTAKCWDEDWINLYYQLTFDPDSSSQAYAVLSPRPQDAGGYSQVLNFSYEQYSSQNGGSPAYVVWGDLQCQYTANSVVAFLGTNIKIDTTVNAFVHVNVEGGVTEGNFASYASEIIYTISVDQNGNLSVNSPTPTVTDNSQTPDTSGWSKFATLGTVQTVIGQIKTELQDILNDFLAQFDESIGSYINGPQGFIFPAGKSFTFQNPSFSDFQDLTSYIAYVQPA